MQGTTPTFTYTLLKQETDEYSAVEPINENGVKLHDENQHISNCSSGYVSNGTSEMTLSSNNDEAYSSRSCSISAGETPDHNSMTNLPNLNDGNQEENNQSSSPVENHLAVVRRPKAIIDKLASLQPHRASCPDTFASMNALSDSDVSQNHASLEQLQSDEVFYNIRFVCSLYPLHCLQSDRALKYRTTFLIKLCPSG